MEGSEEFAVACELRVKKGSCRPFGRARDCSGNPASPAGAEELQRKARFLARERQKGAHLFLNLLTLVFFLSGALLLGQEAGYRIEEDGRFVQTLRWQEQENVLFYDVEIERQEGAGWTKTLQRETEAAFLEVSLGPGVYRYRVRVYDVLGRPAGFAEWTPFEVYLAKDPVILSFGPDGFYLDEDVRWVLNLGGRNLAAGVEIFLESVESGGGRIRPERVSLEPSENGARLVFGYNQLDRGDYVIRAVNPGGLETSLGTFRITFRKPVDINVSLGYRPMLPLYGKTNDLFGTAFYPLGVYGRLNLIPLKRRWGYVGIELEPSWNYLHAGGTGYKVRAQMAGAAAYLLYQYWFENRVMALSFRMGGGLYSVFDYYFTYTKGKSEAVSVLLPAVAGGLSFQWFIGKPFFMEAGADFTHIFAAEDPPPGYLRPFVGAGWQF